MNVNIWDEPEPVTDDFFEAKFGSPIHHPRVNGEQPYTEHPVNPGWSNAKWLEARCSGWEKTTSKKARNVTHNGAWKG